MKTAIITGANRGMGFEETKAVAAAGYRVIMACYCPSQSVAAMEQIKRETGNDQIEILPLDLANFQSVREFAHLVSQRFTHLDLLMNNAGTLETGLHTTVDGIERTVSVNYAGPFLLTHLLLPLMGEGSRIVNMASLVYAFGRIALPDLFTRGGKGSFNRLVAYSNSKLAMTLFSLGLAERLKDRGITVNAVDPGIVNTEIIRMQMFFDPLTDWFFRPFIRTPRQGADTAIRLLLEEEKAGVTGHFWRSNKPLKLGKKYREHPMMAQLWKETEQLVGLRGA